MAILVCGGAGYLALCYPAMGLSEKEIHEKAEYRLKDQSFNCFI